MTSYEIVYDAFLAKILDDEWETWSEDELNQDLQTILESALPFFKFPRVSLERDSGGFINDLNSEEIQIIASFMLCEWLNRTIMTWENVKPLYEERDFSQANLIDKFRQLLKEELTSARYKERMYYRSINGKPFDYTRLAGG